MADGIESFQLTSLDYAAFAAFFVVLSLIGYFAGRKERTSPSEYFLAGRKLPWYVVGGSFIASNISSEHFIGMIGAALIYGQCVAMSCWGNVFSFSFLIWLFIPFLLASKVFTIPEFLERRFNPTLRQLFAFVTVLSNVVAFLAAVLYAGAVALNKLFGWDLWTAIVLLGVAAGIWAIYGGLSSVAWTDLFTVVVMILGGVLVTLLGLKMLAGDSGSPIDGFWVMIERNRADEGPWKEAVEATAQKIVHADQYDRLSVFQPITHYLQPWTNFLFGVFSVSIWYNVLNQ
ncbi:MAG: Na+/glucose cotransporter, partial [Planctomycetota bacterium]